jgi:peptidoglycan hydrolase-like protein with peptidoglycan-binding domain
MRLMTERDRFEQLIDDGRIGVTLRKGSTARHAITALQTLLHWLGYDRILRWEKFGADGDYGKSTASAVAEFARRNTSTANGERVTSALAKKILSRYDSLEELKQLSDDVNWTRIEKHYRKGGRERIRIAALQTLLHDLGFDRELNWNRFGADGDYGRSTTAAVAAFGKQEDIGGNGMLLTLPLARRVIARLSPSYGPGWHKPIHKPTPAPGSLNIKSVTGRNNRQELEVSDGIHRKRFVRKNRGAWTLGNQKPAAFVKSHTDRLHALKVTQSEINVIIAVAENEGNLDAINTWDNAFLSFGMFQWTAGTGSGKGELPGLLARIKNEDRDLFERYCGQHGLDVTGLSTGAVYGYFTLRGIRIRTTADKAQLRQAPWAFYFWLAGQDPAVQAIEIRHALGRLDQFYSTDRYQVDGKHQVADLVTSEYGVGLILDNHVNRPAYVKACLSRALAQTGLHSPTEWGTGEERMLIDAYLKIRTTYGRSPMTDAAKRARVTKRYLTNGIISDRRGSFKRSVSA